LHLPLLAAFRAADRLKSLRSSARKPTNPRPFFLHPYSFTQCKGEQSINRLKRVQVPSLVLFKFIFQHELRMFLRLHEFCRLTIDATAPNLDHAVSLLNAIVVSP
jgi:hypothetical protein